ncbi:DUF3310 domain-containing protein [Brevibacillus borstelensis]|uniref:DUF3310 domain-containing protein n=1 Tax=Brevibacillus borstelensis TaxID=45462 RepID=UPI002E210D28|nr:DUF3310 domain-containing protein [Brevibacillus borstelensis]
MLTREEYLKLRQEGLSRTQIQRNHFASNPNKFYTLLSEWGIKEKDAEERALDLMPKTVTADLEKPGQVDEKTQEAKDDSAKQGETDFSATITELKHVITEKDRIIEELTRDRLSLLQALEKRVETANVPSHDPVNHPAHYTAGKVECIDAIEAATTSLTGGQAYATGAAIKYLWRWSRKGGVEDLRKARWYIDRLIAELEVNSDAS